VPNFQVSTTTATLVASTAYSAIELRTTSTLPIKIVKWWVDLNSATSTDKPVLVRAGRFSAAVTTIAGATPSPLSYVGSDSTSVTGASVNATSEGAGTPNNNPDLHYVLPQGGMYVCWETDETAMWLGTSSFWRIQITPGSALTTTTANCGVVYVE
jgi:hypothetical protein